MHRNNEVMTIALLAECPKHMEYGPCGGVELDGSCEVSPARCVFLDLPTVRWHGIERSVEPRAVDPVPEPVASAGAMRMRALLAIRPVLVADFPARALDAASIAECAGILSGRVDAVLAGDAGAARLQFPPSYRAHLIQSAGLAAWAGVNCRDRNRVALEGELAGLAHVGVAGVHCVTGDHTDTGSRPDAAPVFDLDSTETAALAHSAGHLVSVGESPATPPVERRPARLLEKMRAGAEVCFVNHAGGAAPVAEFIDAVQQLGTVQQLGAAQQLGTAIMFIACVPIVIDHESAALLRTFTTLVLPEGYLDRILAARDPFTEGISAAVELGREMLQIHGVRGINLSGGTAPGREAWFSEALARISDELGTS